tara:strand:+ start:670 stop:1035 length:366 start_codon:yes stop_codon:yes gene_type:complete
MDYQKQEKMFVKLYQEKTTECDELKKKVRSLQQDLQLCKEEYEVYKALATDGVIYVNTYSQDCDGVCSYGSSKFDSAEDYWYSYQCFCESAEGSCSWEIVSKEDARPQDECGTYGQGWDIK